MMKKNAAPAQKGITLPELLIALSIGVIVFMSAYGLLSAGLKQFTEGTNQLESQKNGRRIISFFRKKIAAAVSGIKTVNTGEKAPTGLSTGIEFNTAEDNALKNYKGSDGPKVNSETYYLSGGKIMFKDGRGKPPQKIFDGVKSIYFKIFTVERQKKNIPLIMITVKTAAGNQSASYESMVMPEFIGSLKASEGMLIPVLNGYALDSMN